MCFQSTIIDYVRWLPWILIIANFKVETKANFKVETNNAYCPIL